MLQRCSNDFVINALWCVSVTNAKVNKRDGLGFCTENDPNIEFAI